MTDKILQIDINEVLKSRAPGLHRWLPKFMIRGLEKLICQERMNSLLKENHGKTGADFSRGVLEYLSIKKDIEGVENLPLPENKESWRVIFCSNHPLGGLDGMTLIDYLSSKAPDGEIRFIVNDLLMNIPPLREVFLPVNTLKGVQSKDAALEIDRVMQSEVPIIIFPAGLCSRLTKGKIQDLKWNKMFINRAINYQRDIIPIHFSGKNSAFFYNFAKLRKSLKIPVNLEMSLLPREVFKNEGASFKITIGERIPWQELEGGRLAEKTAGSIREKVYSLEH